MFWSLILSKIGLKFLFIVKISYSTGYLLHVETTVGAWYIFSILLFE